MILNYMMLTPSFSMFSPESSAIPGLFHSVAEQPAPPSGAYNAAHCLGQVRNTYVYADLWERPGLSTRDAACSQ